MGTMSPKALLELWEQMMQEVRKNPPWRSSPEVEAKINAEFEAEFGGIDQKTFDEAGSSDEAYKHFSKGE